MNCRDDITPVTSIKYFNVKYFKCHFDPCLSLSKKLLGTYLQWDGTVGNYIIKKAILQSHKYGVLWPKVRKVQL